MSESTDKYGPGAFSIIYPGPLFGAAGAQLKGYREFRDGLSAAVGDPERRRPEIARAVGTLARNTDPYGNVLEHIPGKGVTIVDPSAVVEEAPYYVRDCGPVVARALGEVVAALQRPSALIHLELGPAA